MAETEAENSEMNIQRLNIRLEISNLESIFFVRGVRSGESKLPCQGFKQYSLWFEAVVCGLKQ